jgi:hypothetical protein
MSAAFLDQLPISDEDRARLARFGASTPFALLSIRKASKEAFDNSVGLDRVDRLAKQVETLLNDEQRASLKEPPKPPGPLGARMGPLPKRPD